ncbi:glycine--tRNA ligase subunit beta [Novosphingobium flavum]|uniref:Glycine--tRNA ligase beta subunit n=2 Tax=Novosphingobium flavum TaxID=1778672 RepID=A0A7X1FPY7_9SPHN|nr:glycine--tRNA ligase subunit beta [Novosphingobium flavum]
MGREVPGVDGMSDQLASGAAAKARDFLLELRSEEIPARMQAGARASLEKLFREQMAGAGVSVGAVTVYSTPRRLALIAKGLPDATAAVSEEVKGPRVGAPPQALEGFLRKTGLTAEQLTERDGVLFAITEKPGRDTRAVLGEAIPAICRAFPWPKSMRWGKASISTESLRWVRPLSGIVAIFGQDLVECEVGGVRSGYATLGHRFHHPGQITIGTADDYVEKLRACHVLVDHAEREGMVRELARAAAVNAGLVLVEDEGLVIENAGLTEWPVPLLGRFDEDYLEVPPETIQLTARTNQKYFICRDGAGNLANAFVCTANIEASDGGAAIVNGNRKVLAARLSDARFFWQQDRKTPLSVHAEKLARITFHEKLGTVADKVERVAKLAEWLASEGIVPNCDPALARQAAELCKADLVTEMVGEFPELQGLMGGYYARAEGLPDAVADAIRDHYKPVGQGDEVPTAPVTVAVALADKLDTLAQFFVEGLTPTGSKDPFALRRQALAVLAVLQENRLRVGLKMALAVEMARGVAYRAGRVDADSEVYAAQALANLGEAMPVDDVVWANAEERKQSAVTLSMHRAVDGTEALLNFLAERLKVQQKEAGVRHDLIDAVFALGGDGDFVRLLARVQALQAFVGTDDGVNLLAGYKRAANILKKEDWQGADVTIPRSGDEDPLSGVDDPDMREVALARSQMVHPADYVMEPAEAALVAALNKAQPAARAAVAAEDFAAAMAALAALRGPIDAFFDAVTVNDADANKRATRLDLLAHFRDAVQHVADFSRIEG